jgi:hypothetical protein
MPSDDFEKGLAGLAGTLCASAQRVWPTGRFRFAG